MDLENSWSDIGEDEDIYDSDEEYVSEEMDVEVLSKYTVKEKNKPVINKDFQPLTLLLESEANANLRSCGVLRIIEIIMSEFSSAEVYEIISIYNINKKALLERSRFLEEFVLILYYLESIGIMITKNMFPILFPKISAIINELLSEKKFKRTRKHIRETFILNEMFRVKEFDNNNEGKKNTLSSYIKYYSNGYMLVIKNIIKKYNPDDLDHNLLNDYEKLIKIFSNTNLSFVEDEKLQYLSKWMDGTIKNLILFAEWGAVSDSNFFRFNRRQSKDYLFHSYASVLFYIIETIKTENSKHHKVSLKSFLLVLDDEGIVEELLDNVIFLDIIKTIFNTGKKTVGLKKFVSQIDKFLESMI